MDLVGKYLSREIEQVRGKGAALSYTFSLLNPLCNKTVVVHRIL